MRKFLLVTLLLVTGCHVGPKYDPPCVEVPDQWKGEEQEPKDQLPCVDYWWEVFNDPLLNNLEKAAVKNNPNLFVALARIFEARATAGVSNAQLYPQLNLNPLFESTGLLIKTLLPGGAFIAAPGLARDFRIHEVIYALPLIMKYELDLWGKLRYQHASDLLNAEAKVDAWRATWVTLTSEVASTYFNMRTIDAQIALLKSTVDARRKAYELNLQRFKEGIVPKIDATDAELQLANTESEYYDNIRQRNDLENALAVLIGIPPEDLCIESQPLHGLPPIIPAGVPCTLLKQRPDIAQAERTMASVHAKIGVAYASFLPTFSLTGAIGSESPLFRDFLKWPSRFWAIGWQASQFVFDAGTRLYNAEIAWAQYEEATGNYRQTVLTAFQEVDDALNDLEMQAKQGERLEVALRAAQETYRLSNDRYINGIVTYLEVVQNEQQELAAEQTYINVLGLRYQSTINLIKALGGSWNNDGDDDDDGDCECECECDAIAAKIN